MLGKTVLLPYGAIEDEPSYPATNLQIDAHSQAVRRALPPRIPSLAGVMGNVQTPLLQFPARVLFHVGDVGTSSTAAAPKKKCCLTIWLAICIPNKAS